MGRRCGELADPLVRHACLVRPLSLRWCSPLSSPLPGRYDIELVQEIEGLVGQQLDKYEPEEGEVLKGITKVGPAHSSAPELLSLMLSNGFNEGRGPAPHWPAARKGPSVCPAVCK